LLFTALFAVRYQEAVADQSLCQHLTGRLRLGSWAVVSEGKKFIKDQWSVERTCWDGVWSGLHPWPVAVLYRITSPSLDADAIDPSWKPNITDVTAALCAYMTCVS